MPDSTSPRDSNVSLFSVVAFLKYDIRAWITIQADTGVANQALNWITWEHVFVSIVASSV